MVRSRNNVIYSIIIIGIVAFALTALFTPLREILLGLDIDGWTAVGVIAAVGVAGVGFFFAYKAENRSSNERSEGVVQGYSQQITELREKESSLDSKKSCETYAVNFVDLLDRIAYLYLAESLPKNTIGYFENEFSYALTMLQWIEKYDIIEYLPKGQDSLWADLEILCKHGKQSLDDGINERKVLEYSKDYSSEELEKSKEELKEERKKRADIKKIEREKDYEYAPFQEIQLPESMNNYDNLPDKGVDPIRQLELVKDYAKILTDLAREERYLKNKLDCEVYAAAYLDTLDQIAYLQIQDAIQKEVLNYFHNNFKYGMTLFNWYNNNVRTPNQRAAAAIEEPTWSDLKEWCQKQGIEKEDEEDILPQKMLKYSKPRK